MSRRGRYRKFSANYVPEPWYSDNEISNIANPGNVALNDDRVDPPFDGRAPLLDPGEQQDPPPDPGNTNDGTEHNSINSGDDLQLSDFDGEHRDDDVLMSDDVISDANEQEYFHEVSESNDDENSSILTETDGEDHIFNVESQPSDAEMSETETYDDLEEEELFWDAETDHDEEQEPDAVGNDVPDAAEDNHEHSNVDPEDVGDVDHNEVINHVTIEDVVDDDGHEEIVHPVDVDPNGGQNEDIFDDILVDGDESESEIEEFEEVDDYDSILHFLSKEWLTTEVHHRVSKTASDAFWALAKKWFHKLFTVKKIQKVTRKTPDFVHIRRRLYLDYVPPIKMDLGYRNKEIGEISVLENTLVTPKSQFPRHQFDKIFEIGHVEVIISSFSKMGLDSPSSNIFFHFEVFQNKYAKKKKTYAKQLPRVRYCLKKKDAHLHSLRK